MSDPIFTTEKTSGGFVNVVTIPLTFSCGCTQPVGNLPPPILSKDKQKAPFGDDGKVHCSVCDTYVNLVKKS